MNKINVDKLRVLLEIRKQLRKMDKDDTILLKIENINTKRPHRIQWLLEKTHSILHKGEYPNKFKPLLNSLREYYINELTEERKKHTPNYK